MHKKTLTALAALVLALTGCEKSVPPGTPSGVSPTGQAASGNGAAVSISTVHAQQRDYPVQLEATGTVTALNSVDLRPQISSTITQVHFREGQFVKAGQLLFTLDSRTDETNVLKARAQLQKDLASLADAQRQLARSKELLAQSFVSQTAVDTNQTLAEAQKAAVDADRAALKAAEVGLSYTRITAPMSGRAGTVNVFPGTLVQPTSPPLVTITQLDPIAVSFSLPQRNLSDALQVLRMGGGTVVAELPEGRGKVSGKLRFVDNTVDANSGTVKVKAVFANPDELLWPGAFVDVTMTVQTLKNAIVVPQASIVQGARERMVFVVEDNKAAARPVEVVLSAGTDAVVTGVKAGERVVLDGRQNLRPGSTVIEHPVEAASAPASASAAAHGRRGQHTLPTSNPASGSSAVRR
jgi:RND family efflux transporter MFP subunit